MCSWEMPIREVTASAPMYQCIRLLVFEYCTNDGIQYRFLVVQIRTLDAVLGLAAAMLVVLGQRAGKEHQHIKC